MSQLGLSMDGRLAQIDPVSDLDSSSPQSKLQLENSNDENHLTTTIANNNNETLGITKSVSYDALQSSPSNKKRLRRRPPSQAPIALPNGETGQSISDDSNIAPASALESRKEILAAAEDNSTEKNPFIHLGKVPSNFEKHALSIRLHQTDPLPLDKHLLHPFVRVHVIDTLTGTYLKKSDPSRSVTERMEPENLDYILPLMSKVNEQTNKQPNYADLTNFH